MPVITTRFFGSVSLFGAEEAETLNGSFFLAGSLAVLLPGRAAERSGSRGEGRSAAELRDCMAAAMGRGNLGFDANEVVLYSILMRFG